LRDWRACWLIGDNLGAMGNLNRRDFLKTASAASLATSASNALAAGQKQRVFIGSGTPDGILAYDWDGTKGELRAAGVAAKISTVDWVTPSPRRDFLYAAAEVDTFNGKPTGEVASFRIANGELQPMSAENSASPGTCHVALDQTGRVLLSADYGGGSATSFLVEGGKLSTLVWTEHYTVHGPNKDRQQSAHAHFASYSPDNRFAYINDLGHAEARGHLPRQAGSRLPHTAFSSQRAHRLLRERAEFDSGRAPLGQIQRKSDPGYEHRTAAGGVSRTDDGLRHGDHQRRSVCLFRQSRE
jgi:hypothetical protein